MKFADVWVAGTGGVLGERVPIAEAVAAGRYDPAAAAASQMVSYAVAGQAPPTMAVTAGRTALKEAAEYGVESTPDTLFVHSHTSFQGIDLWPAQCWIAGELLGTQLDEMPMTVDAASNGSLAALGVAATALESRPELPAALITVADRFAPPVDRWNLSPGMVFGDGAAAAVLTRGRGQFRLLSLVSRTDTALEGLSRGDEPFRESPVGVVDTARRTREFLARGELSLRDVRARSADGVRTVVTRALADAGVASVEDIDWYLAPFVGRALYQDGFVRPLPGKPKRTLADLGLTIGHLGPGDQLYALHHLVEEGLLRPGQRLMLVGTGMGFTFSAAVLTVADDLDAGSPTSATSRGDR